MKMTFKQFLPIPIIVAAVAAGLVVCYQEVFPKMGPASRYLNGALMAVTFQAWAMYFMAGCKPLGGLKNLLGYLGGIVASVAIIELTGLFKFAGPAAMPLAVFLVVIPVIMAERVKLIDFVPAWFVGSGIFFVFNGNPGMLGDLVSLPAVPTVGDRIGANIDVGLCILAACLVGQIFGVITVVLRSVYESMVPKQPEAAPATAPAAPAAPAPAPVVEPVAPVAIAPAPCCAEESATEEPCACGEEAAKTCDGDCDCDKPE